MGKRKDIKTLFRESLPKEKKPVLTPEQTEKLKTISSVVLAVLAVGGVVVLSAAAPNIFLAVDKVFNQKRKRGWSRKETEEKVTKAFYYLKKTGQIKIAPTASDFRVSLTGLGRRRLERFDIDTLSIPRPKSWNGLWWQVVADIPTKSHRRGADLLREKLKETGFFSLQRTVWLYPFDPRREIEFISEYYGISRFLTVMEISRMDKQDEGVLKKHFERIGVLE